MRHLCVCKNDDESSVQSRNTGRVKYTFAYIGFREDANRDPCESHANTAVSHTSVQGSKSIYSDGCKCLKQRFPHAQFPTGTPGLVKKKRIIYVLS